MASFVQTKLSSIKQTGKNYQDLIDQTIVKFEKEPVELQEALDTLLIAGVDGQMKRWMVK